MKNIKLKELFHINEESLINELLERLKNRGMTDVIILEYDRNNDIRLLIENQLYFAVADIYLQAFNKCSDFSVLVNFKLSKGSKYNNVYRRNSVINL